MFCVYKISSSSLCRKLSLPLAPVRVGNERCVGVTLTALSNSLPAKGAQEGGGVEMINLCLQKPLSEFFGGGAVKRTGYTYVSGLKRARASMTSRGRIASRLQNLSSQWWRSCFQRSTASSANAAAQVGLQRSSLTSFSASKV